jgi:hypothetical protein
LLGGGRWVRASTAVLVTAMKASVSIAAPVRIFAMAKV